MGPNQEQTVQQVQAVVPCTVTQPYDPTDLKVLEISVVGKDTA